MITLPPPSPTTTALRSTDKERWCLVIVTCLVLTVFNVLGTRHAAAASRDATIVMSENDLPTSFLSWRHLDNDDDDRTRNTITRTTAIRHAATIQNHLHSENFRLDPTLLHRQTSNLSYTQVWQAYGWLPSIEKNDPLPLYYNRSLIPLESICAQTPGQGLEGPQGYEILQKVQIANDTNHHQPQPRLLCAIYTHPLMHQLVRAAALTWGRHCNGFVAFSLETIPELNLLYLQHPGPEAYQNMWRKTRSIWQYVYRHYGKEYDLFHLGGDDMYVIPENLKLKYTQLLASASSTQESKNTTPAIFLGQWVPHGPDKHFVGGGGGYTLNQPALRALVEQALPHCHVNTTASFEDRLVTKCLHQIGIQPSDTRDPLTAEQTYHDHNPQSLFDTIPVPPGNSRQRRRASFHAKAAAYWETLPHPTQPNVTVGPRTGLQAVATHSVSFHKIHFPDYMVRLHVLLRPHLCPARIEDSSTTTGY